MSLFYFEEFKMVKVLLIQKAINIYLKHFCILTMSTLLVYIGKMLGIYFLSLIGYHFFLSHYCDIYACEIKLKGCKLIFETSEFYSQKHSLNLEEVVN